MLSPVRHRALHGISRRPVRRGQRAGDVAEGSGADVSQCTSSTALRITIAPNDSAASVLVDVRRTSIYNGSTVETLTLNGSTVSGRVVLDDIVYTNSQESHSMQLRQQNPATKLWSLCGIHSFLSAGGARVSVRIQWSEYDVSYEVPTV